MISHSIPVPVSRSLQVSLLASQPTESAAGGESCGEPAISHDSYHVSLVQWTNLFASRHKDHRFKSPGGYLCETGILLLALSRYSIFFVFPDSSIFFSLSACFPCRSSGLYLPTLKKKYRYNVRAGRCRHPTRPHIYGENLFEYFNRQCSPCTLGRGRAAEVRALDHSFEISSKSTMKNPSSPTPRPHTSARHIPPAPLPPCFLTCRHRRHSP